MPEERIDREQQRRYDPVDNRIPSGADIFDRPKDNGQDQKRKKNVMGIVIIPGKGAALDEDSDPFSLLR